MSYKTKIMSESMNQMKRILSLIGFLGCGALMSGCAGTHIYRQADYDAATKTEASFKAANLSQMLVAERKQVDAISEREQAVVKRQTLALRDTSIMAIVECPNALGAAAKLYQQITNRIVKLIGNQDLDTIANDWIDIDDARNTKKKFASLYRPHAIKNGYPDLPEDSTAKNVGALRDKIPNGSEAADAFDSYIEACKDLESLQKAYETDVTHDPRCEITKLTKMFITIDEQKKKLAEDIASRKGEFEAAKTNYQNALAAGSTNISALAAKLTNALARLDLGNAAEAITNLQNAFPGRGFEDFGLAGKIAKLEQQKVALLVLANIMMADKTDTNLVNQAAGMPTLLFLAGVLPTLNQVLERPPSVGNLLLKMQQYSIALDAAKRRLNHANVGYQLLEQKRDFMHQELANLQLAQTNSLQLTASLGRNTNSGGINLPLALAKLNSDDSQKGFSALLYYSLSWQLGRTGEDLADYKAFAEQHQAILDDSEIALMEWENLIGVPLSQLVALHGSGIKPETIANFCNAIMLTAAVAAK
jgi:tetratricopeptide (TPR) repeat protein